MQQERDYSMEKLICVYCSSSDAVNPDFFNFTKELGKKIVENNYGLVYGGGNIGLMGALAQSVKQNNGKVVGVIPKALHEKGLSFKESDKLIIAKDLRDRKAIMEEYAHAFIGLPGGFGTLEEILEVLTLKQLKFHNKAIVFLSYRNFFKSLKELFNHIYTEKFAKEDYKKLYCFTDSIKETFEYIDQYKPVELSDKWYKNPME
jgi:uncharacterized protein (TIGR00730 family)